MAKAGTAFVDFQGDFTGLQKQLGAQLSAGKMSKAGKAAGVALVGGLAAAGITKALFDLGKQFDSAFDEIRVGTGATGKALEGLKKDFKGVVRSVPTDFKSAGKAVADLNTRLGLTGRPLQNMAAQMLELSRITKTDLDQNIKEVTRTFGDWGIATKKQPAALDKMFRASQATGISVAQLGTQMVRYGAPLRQMGFGFDQAAGLVGKFEKEGVNAQLVMGSLRIALGKMAKEGVKDPAKALQGLTKDIAKAGTTGEANALALETFGARAGPDMAAAIREGRFNLGELFNTIENGDETVRKAGKETMSFGEQWTLLKNRVLVGLEPLASGVFNAIGDGMQKVAELTAGGPEGELARGRFIKSLGLDPIAVRDAFQSVGRSISSTVRAIKEILNSGLVRFMSGVVLGSIKRSLSAIVQIFKGWAQVVSGTIQLINNLLHLRFGKAWDNVKQIFRGGVNATIGLLRHMTAPVRELGSRIGDALSKPFKAVWNTIKSIFTTGIRLALAPLRAQIAVARRLGSSIGGGLVDGLKSALRGVGRVIINAIEFTGSLAKGIGNKLIDLLNDAIPNKIPIPKAPDINLPDNPIPKLAKGGPAHGLAIVGEQGPELASFPAGSRVYSHSRSKSMLRRAGAAGVPGFSGGGMVHVPGDPPGPFRDSVARSIAGAVAEFIKRYNLNITAAFNPGRGHKSPGHNITGRSTDLVPRGGSWDTLERGLRVLTGRGYNVIYGTNGIGSSLKDHGRGLHAHVDWPTNPQGFGGGGSSGRAGGKAEGGYFEKMARGIRRIGKRGKIPFKVRLAAMMASLQEASSADAVGDGGRAVGPFQIHPQHIGEHGLKNRTSISQSIKWWFGEAMKLAWQKMSLNDIAQGVERSANPNAYAKHRSRASALFRKTRSAADKDEEKDGKAKPKKKKLSAEERYRKAYGHDPFKLGGLEAIGKGGKAWHIGGLQSVLDNISHAAAQADLTEPLGDDIAAAERLVTVWSGIHGLTMRQGTIAQQTEAAINLKSARDALESLQGESSGGGDDDASNTASIRADLLQRLLADAQKDNAILRAQMPIFKRFARAPFAGTFHNEGIVPGPIGAERTALVQGGERITQPGSDAQSITVVVEDGAVDPNKIRVVVNDEVSEMVRKAKSGPAVGRRYSFR